MSELKQGKDYLLEKTKSLQSKLVKYENIVHDPNIGEHCKNFGNINRSQHKPSLILEEEKQSGVSIENYLHTSRSIAINTWLTIRWSV